ncbi:hypothetical protein V22_23560 [Calycomorphotria hydatis]|uniref:Uncharacterized protein n=2 Tax=Calycomorphotria hydatis TaxID=2528027 RepID=A0A517T9Q7_9PLAN|nr:hypothetical protein V22_23560 [Calycomorphotria hydatis]
MNYFAHGCRFIDRPYFLAGTACPDWLSAVARRTRLRSRRVRPFVECGSSEQEEFAAGVLQHLHDDDWFHSSRGFAEVSSLLGREFRNLLGPEDRFRPGLLGHIGMEMILDAILLRRDPGRLDQYYASFSQIDPAVIQQAVNSMATRQTTELEKFIPLFIEIRFLDDYVTPAGLLYRLNQVLRRVKLDPLPGEAEAVVEAGFELVAEREFDLLPPERFQWNR